MEEVKFCNPDFTTGRKKIVYFSGLHLHFWKRKIGDLNLISVLYVAEM